MLFSKVYADLKRELPHHQVVRTRHLGHQTFTFKPREGSRPIYYTATEFRGSVVLRNLNTGIAKSYNLSDKENLLCMLRAVQQRQIKNKCGGFGHGSANTIPNFFGALASSITGIARVKHFTIRGA